MNKMKEVAKALGYEVGEEFNLIFTAGKYSRYNPFKFTETDLVDKNGDVFTNYIGRIITGEYKIKKIPFIPKVGEYYWTYVCCEQVHVVQYGWRNDYSDKEHKLLGIIFKTEKEALNYLPTWEKRLKGEKL
jgi:hypothetical protein